MEIIIYLKNYKNYSTKFNSFLLADSHGLPLKNYTEKNGVYNFSAGSDSYFDMKRKINFLLTQTKVDVIYITVDDHALSSYREKVNNLDRSIYFSTINDYSNVFLFLKEKGVFNIAFLQPKKRTIFKKYLKKYISSFFQLNNNGNSKSITNKPWVKMSKNEQFNSSKKRFDYQFPKTDSSKLLEEALLEIIQICKKNNITLIGLKFPLSQEYLEIMGDQTYGASKIFNENGLKVLDFKSKLNLEDDFFYDQDHLNDEGGIKFTKILFNKSL